MKPRSASTGVLVVSLPSSRKLTLMLASTGVPSSSVRHRPMASKFSCMNPKGLMTPWQPWHRAGIVTDSIRWRSVAPAVGGIVVLTSGGGFPIAMHITLRVKNTPRFTRRVVVGPECDARTAGCVKMPSRFVGSRSTIPGAGAEPVSL